MSEIILLLMFVYGLGIVTCIWFEIIYVYWESWKLNLNSPTSRGETIGHSKHQEARGKG